VTEAKPARVSKVIRDEASAPFFDATARGELVVRRSEDGTYLEPAASVGPTAELDLTWAPASLDATLVSWTITPGRVKDGVAAPDTCIGVVELAEGPWLTLQLPDAQLGSDLQAGMPIRIGFTPVEGAEALPVGRLP
jgi:uncharacterized protein